MHCKPCDFLSLRKVRQDFFFSPWIDTWWAVLTCWWSRRDRPILVSRGISLGRTAQSSWLKLGHTPPNKYSFSLPFWCYILNFMNKCYVKYWHQPSLLYWTLSGSQHPCGWLIKCLCRDLTPTDFENHFQRLSAFPLSSSSHRHYSRPCMGPCRSELWWNGCSVIKKKEKKRKK